MNLYTKRIDLCFFSALLLFLCMPVLLPSLRLFFLVPFLIILFYKRKLSTCLWSSLGCGLIVDLFSYSRFGMIAFSYVCATWILYRFKRHFFADSLSTLPIMTFLFSSLSIFIQFLLLSTFEKDIQLSWQWWISDLIVFPLLDALYGFAVYIVPGWLFGKPIRKGRDYFLDEGLELGSKNTA